MKFHPLLTRNRKIKDLFPAKNHDCEIRDAQGKLVFSMKGVRAPQSWSPLAIEIVASKYLRKTGVGKEGSEKSIYQMIERVVGAIVKQGKKQKYFSSAQAAKNFEQELTYILLDQRAFFNSPVWFNCGLYEAYGIRAEATQWAWDEKKKKPLKIMDAYQRPQVSACFIQSVEDSLEGIFELAQNEARLFKYGSGSGTNFSTLRSKYENIESGGTSSGLMSFLEVLDKGAGAVKSGGVTRRAAKMVILDVDHPEIGEFIEWKAKEEKKAQALIQAGFNGDFEGEAYKTVSGQNANTSVRVSDEFLSAVEKNQTWKLKSRTTGEVIQEISARELWSKITQAAWECADPGLQFDDVIQRYHTCPKSGPIRASNPCSEYLFLDESACNLASLNLKKFLDKKNEFQIAEFLHTARVILTAQDILVDYAGYPTEKICQNSHDYRSLGLGFAGLGAFFMLKGLAYESEAARQWGSILSSLLTAMAYQTSAELAKEKSTFKYFSKNKTAFKKVIALHVKANKSLRLSQTPSELQEIANEIWDEVAKASTKQGFRNAQVTVMAPTGTIGLAMDSDTTGIEPEFSLIKNKKMAGGLNLKIYSHVLQPALQILGFSEEKIRDIFDYLELRGTLIDCPLLTKEQRRIFACALDIQSKDHLLMMAAIQPLISGAISKTVNLPAETSQEEVSNIYMQAWKLGLKSITIYREKSKGSQPLNKFEPILPKCPDCGAPTELAGGCFRCINCGAVIGCA